jgi:hypothetical protein
MAKPFDPKAKAKRQKIIAAVLGVVFLGVMVYQAPTVLGMFGGSSATQTESAGTTTPPPAAPTTPAPGAPAAPAPAAPAAPTAELVDSDVAPAPTTGQLVTFDRFESKDPFVQQVGNDDGTAGGPAAPPANNDEGTPPPDAGEENRQPQPPPAPARPQTARISVNGAATDVAVDGTFPEGDPIFKLVSLTKSTAKVGIVGGTYASGSQAITLKKGGKPVTLMNTADGTTYVLRLLSVG